MLNLSVSVVVTVLNEAQGLAPLIEPLLAQTRLPDEIVVVDGGSRDGTWQLLERYAEKEPRIRPVSAPGANIARGRNLGIAQARGEIIAVTDGGCIPEPVWLEELIEGFCAPEVLAVAGSFRGEWRTRFEYYAGLLAAPRGEGAPPEENPLFFGRSSAFRKSAWERAGGYPEWLYTAEDTLFALRVQMLGGRVASRPRALVAWRPRPNLRKLAKMYFLYGRGNGRIRLGSLRGSVYWLRYHAVWMLCTLGGFLFPPLWIPALLVLVYLYRVAALPVVRDLRESCRSLSREFYLPLMVLTRNATSNAGYLVGWWEYRFQHRFRKQLVSYLGEDAPW